MLPHVLQEGKVGCGNEIRYLQDTLWAPGQNKEGKNTSNDYTLLIERLIKIDWFVQHKEDILCFFQYPNYKKKPRQKL